MKKTYTIPVLRTRFISSERMLASSDPATLHATIGEGTISEGYADVKGGRGTYSVWTDDWSAQ